LARGLEKGPKDFGLCKKQVKKIGKKREKKKKKKRGEIKSTGNNWTDGVSLVKMRGDGGILHYGERRVQRCYSGLSSRIKKKEF